MAGIKLHQRDQIRDGSNKWVCQHCKGTDWYRHQSKRYCKKCGWKNV